MQLDDVQLGKLTHLLDKGELIVLKNTNNHGSFRDICPDLLGFDGADTPLALLDKDQTYVCCTTFNGIVRILTIRHTADFYVHACHSLRSTSSTSWTSPISPTSSVSFVIARLLMISRFICSSHQRSHPSAQTAFQSSCLQSSRLTRSRSSGSRAKLSQFRFDSNNHWQKSLRYRLEFWEPDRK